MAQFQFPAVPKKVQNTTEYVQRIVAVVNRILDGGLNSTGEVTLSANQATSTVTDKKVTASSAVLFSPTTANAAAEQGAGGMYISTRTSGSSFVITHANNAQTDRTFTYVIIG